MRVRALSVAHGCVVGAPTAGEGEGDFTARSRGCEGMGGSSDACFCSNDRACERGGAPERCDDVRCPSRWRRRRRPAAASSTRRVRGDMQNGVRCSPSPVGSRAARRGGAGRSESGRGGPRRDARDEAGERRRRGASWRARRRRRGGRARTFVRWTSAPWAISVLPTSTWSPSKAALLSAVQLAWLGFCQLGLAPRAMAASTAALSPFPAAL